MYVVPRSTAEEVALVRSLNDATAGRLYALRREHKITARRMAAAMGVSKACYYAYENGRRTAKLAALWRLRNVFGFGWSQLLPDPGEGDHDS